MNTEAQALKRIALERYDQDGGTMYECSDAADYVQLIEEHGTAEAAWKAHMGIHAARREVCAAYEAEEFYADPYQEHVQHSAPCVSRWDGFDRGDDGEYISEEQQAFWDSFVGPLFPPMPVDEIPF